MQNRAELPLKLAAFAGIYLIWGTSYLASAFALRTLPPFAIGALRFMTAGILMYVWLRARDPRPFAGVNVPAAIVCGVLMSGIGNGFVMWAQQGVPSGFTALFVASLPMVVLLFDWAFFARHRPAIVATLGVLLGLAGVAVLTLNARHLSGRVHAVHIASLIIAILAWSVVTLLQRRYMPPLRIVNFTCLQVLAGAAFQLLAVVADREWIGYSLHQIAWQSIVGVCYLSIFGTLIANNCYSYLITRVSAQKVSTYAFVNPVIALGLGALVLAEPITPATLAASALVLLGVALVLFEGVRRRLG